MTDPTPAGKGASVAPCPNCGELTSGRFCSNCGVPLGNVACGACHAQLAPGARFCHVCGTPVASPTGVAATAKLPITPAPHLHEATTGTPRGSNLPLAIVAIAFLAVVAIVAAQSFARTGAGTEQSAGPIGSQTAAAPRGPAPDISNMSPQERASRLYDRVMSAFEAGHMDTVRMFAPMATGAYEMLDSLTLDDRYDLGRIGEISGALPLAAAQADTILQSNPDHLLGLILAAQVAHSRNDLAGERQYLGRLLKAAPGEQAKNRPEYREHQHDITAALAAARKGQS